MLGLRTYLVVYLSLTMVSKRRRKEEGFSLSPSSRCIALAVLSGRLLAGGREGGGSLSTQVSGKMPPSAAQEEGSLASLSDLEPRQQQRRLARGIESHGPIAGRQQVFVQ